MNMERKVITNSIQEDIYKEFRSLIVNNYGARKMNLVLENILTDYILINTELNEEMRRNFKAIKNKNKNILRVNGGKK